MDWKELLIQYLPVLNRLAAIFFSTLGIVYMSGRLLFPKLKDRGKNIIAFASLVIISFAMTLIKDYGIGALQANSALIPEYLFDSAQYAAGSAVFYITIGWRFYSRMDSLLDRKVGKDDRRKK